MRAVAEHPYGHVRRLATVLLGLAVCNGVAAAGVVIEADGYVNEQPRGEAVAGPAPAPATAGMADTAATPTTGVGSGAGGSGSASSGTGPGVEMISGGNSKDGAAHVGRLPVLE